METIETYLDEIAAAGAGKIIISKPANKAEEYKKIVIEKKESYFQAAAYTQKQVFHENIRMEELGTYLKTTVSGFYLQVNAWDETTEYILLISKKGKATYQKKKKKETDAMPKTQTSHNRKKKYILEEGTPIAPLVDMGIFTTEGKVVRSMYDKFRQINRFLEMIEDEVADYVKETDNHVMYRVTPIYSGDDLVASGVQMEAKSVEDDGAGVTFNVYVYNVQPYVVINYETGESYQTEELATPEGEWAPGTEAEVTDKNVSNSSTTSKSTKKETYILNRNTKKFHKSTCSGVKDIKAENKEEYTGSRSDLIKEGYEPCGRCKPYRENNLSCSVTIAQNLWDSWKSQIV